MMIDKLKDLISHTHDLGCIDLIKVVGTDESTTLHGMANDNSFVMNATFNEPIPEFVGVFGMPQMSRLKNMVYSEWFQSDTTITVNRSGSEPDNLSFKSENGFFNSYRFMAREMVQEQIDNLEMIEPAWHVEFEPCITSIQQLRSQSMINSDENTFMARTENDDLIFYFGDESTHNGNFKFAIGVGNGITHGYNWPVKRVLDILSLSGDKVFRMSNEGMTQIIVSDPIATYTYSLLAFTR